MTVLLFWIKSQPGVAYKSDAYKKILTLFCSLLNMNTMWGGGQKASETSY